ncbi:MAG: nucleotidyltransferase domain-containing protein [Dehalococcoidia bacterium]
MSLDRDVIAILRAHPAVASIVLTGSRAAGTPNDLSDWDFALETSDFARLAADLPALVEPLAPILRQWDPLGHVATYMLMLPDATKVDLIFPSVSQEEAPPWVASATTLQAIDDHFWDWIIWLASKDRGGKADLVAAELRKLSAHILRPLGVVPPTTVRAAIGVYVAARELKAARLGVRVSSGAQEAVLGRLREAGYPV